MIQENAPVFGAAGQGLAAFYNIDFNVDLTHEIPCAGTWQGDKKACRTLYVNNYDNNFAISITTRSGTVKCPAYSQGNISLTSDDRITAVSEGHGIVPMTLYTDVRPATGFASRGTPPQANIDPFYGKLIGLYHFKGAGNHFSLDSAINGFGLIKSIPWDVYGNGSTLLYSAGFTPTSGLSFNRVTSASGFPNGAPTGALVQSVNSIQLLKNFTIEFDVTVYVKPNIDFKKVTIINIGGLTVELKCYSAPNSFTIAGTAVGNSAEFTGKKMNLFTKYRIAVVVFEGSYAFTFINGQLDYQDDAARAIPVPAAANVLQMAVIQSQENPDWMIDIDEVRITNAARYTTNYDSNVAFYDPPTQ